MRRLLVVWLFFAGAIASCDTALAGDVGPRPPGSFDYYVLALTWVPAFCATHQGDEECSKGLGFALHGLWPQLEGGDYPSNCSGNALTSAERGQYASLYPGSSMIDHEWTKHGTCSGLTPEGYFALTTADENTVTIPPAFRAPETLRDAGSVRQAFLDANTGLPADGINIVVARGSVTEVQICLTKDGAFRSCS